MPLEKTQRIARRSSFGACGRLSPPPGEFHRNRHLRGAIRKNRAAGARLSLYMRLSGFSPREAHYSVMVDVAAAYVRHTREAAREQQLPG
jgi:hypothetical protein